MKKKEMKKIALAVALAALGLAGVAQATPLLEVIPVPQTTVNPASDEAPPSFPYNIPDTYTGYVSYLKLVDSSVPSGTLEAVNFSLWGHGDAAYNNQFLVFGSQADLATQNNALIDWHISGNPGNGSLAQTVYLPVDELLPFKFIANSDPTYGEALNDGVNNTIEPPNFALFDVNQTGDITQGTGFWIGLSDQVGEVPDYQDMVIKATVPEPGSVFLVVAGLLGLAGLRRRKA